MRVRIVECIANCIHLLDFEAHFPIICSIVHWCVLTNLPTSYGNASESIWSVRKSAFQLLNSIITCSQNMATQNSISPSLSLFTDLALHSRSLLLKCIEFTVSEDKKHSQLITAAIQHGILITGLIKQLSEQDYIRVHFTESHSLVHTVEFLSKDEFVNRMNKIMAIILNKYPDVPVISQELAKLQQSLRNI